MDIIMIVLPAFIIFGAGYIGQKVFALEIRSISTIALYLMFPFLVFDTFYSNKLNADYLYMFLFSLILVIILVVLTIIVGRIFHADRARMSVLLLGTVFPNSGNYGVPVILFAFGYPAFDYAIIIMVIHLFFINSIGTFIASFGGNESASIKEAMMSVVKMPVLYGAFLGALFQLVQIDLPTTMMNAVSLVGNAAIPTVMLILGMQLAEIKRQRFQMKYIYTVTSIRMVVSPLIAIVLASFMPVNDMIKTVFILLAAMPVAANTILLALQFDVEADLLSFSTLVTTLISILTIPLMLYFLGGVVG